jgi:glycolate oxidase iron-sulfur subunit
MKRAAAFSRERERRSSSKVATYNILEPEIAARLRDRKIANIVQTSPDLVATGNIGCIAQIASGTSIPVLHTIELLDFAHGGPTPDGLASLAG